MDLGIAEAHEMWCFHECWFSFLLFCVVSLHVSEHCLCNSVSDVLYDLSNQSKADCKFLHVNILGLVKTTAHGPTPVEHVAARLTAIMHNVFNKQFSRHKDRL